MTTADTITADWPAPGATEPRIMRVLTGHPSAARVSWVALPNGNETLTPFSGTFARCAEYLRAFLVNGPDPTMSYPNPGKGANT